MKWIRLCLLVYLSMILANGTRVGMAEYASSQVSHQYVNPVPQGQVLIETHLNGIYLFEVIPKDATNLGDEIELAEQTDVYQIKAVDWYGQPLENFGESTLYIPTSMIVSQVVYIDEQGATDSLNFQQEEDYVNFIGMKSGHYGIIYENMTADVSGSSYLDPRKFNLSTKMMVFIIIVFIYRLLKKHSLKLSWSDGLDI